MRLRTFTAPTIAEAMRQVRNALGEDAVILATEETGRLVKLTAAIDPNAAVAAPAPVGAAVQPLPGSDEGNAIAAALRYHNVPQGLIDPLLAMTAGFDVADAPQALTAAFRARFAFQPLTDHVPGRPIMLAGLPGAGKSSTLAKLAAHAKAKGRPVTAITCDLAKAGAVEQLATYAKALEIPAYRAKDTATLQRAVARADAKGMILIDTIGTNPLLPGDLDQLRDLAAGSGAEIVLVLAAGGDAGESAELAAAYAAIGATRLIATKMDAARRFGGILAALEVGRLSLAGFGTSPQIVSGLAAPRADRLCRLFLPADAVREDGPTPTNDGTRRQAGAHARPAPKLPPRPQRGAAS